MNLMKVFSNPTLGWVNVKAVLWLFTAIIFRFIEFFIHKVFFEIILY